MYKVGQAGDTLERTTSLRGANPSHIGPMRSLGSRVTTASSSCTARRKTSLRGITKSPRVEDAGATREVEADMTRNPIAKALANPICRKRIVKARKGKGAYTRKVKHGG